jgi:hypothetical protein
MDTTGNPTENSPELPDENADHLEAAQQALNQGSPAEDDFPVYRAVSQPFDTYTLAGPLLWDTDSDLD